jgi:hypothetical protein
MVCLALNQRRRLYQLLVVQAFSQLIQKLRPQLRSGQGGKSSGQFTGAIDFNPPATSIIEPQ